MRLSLLAKPRTARAVALLLLAASLQGQALDLTGTFWEASAHRQGLDPTLLYALAMQETQRPSGPGTVSPWPWTLRTPTGPRFYASREGAAADLRAMTRDTRDIDVGLLQVNLERHGDRVGDPATLLDARVNLAVAADILTDAIRSAGDDLALGVGRYRHPGDDRAARAYGRRALRLRDALREQSSKGKGNPHGVLDLWRASAVLDLVAVPESRGNYNAWYAHAHQSQVQRQSVL